MALLAHRPAAVAFDVIETLFALDGLRPRLEAAGIAPTALEWWFARTLRDGFALAASGDHQPFAKVAEAALVEVARSAGTEPAPDLLRAVLEGFSALEAHPDAGPALARVAEAGLPVLALTNGSPDTTRGLLARAGLDRYVQRVVSIDEVGHWKPRPEVYHYAAGQAGVAPGELALVAVHAWDVHGAAQAGLVTGWAARLEGEFSPVFGFPHVHAEGLLGVVEGLLALPAR